MAENPQQVLVLARSGKTRAPARRKELAQLRAFAKAEFGVDELQPSDIAYYSENRNNTSTASAMNNCVDTSGKQSG